MNRNYIDTHLAVDRYLRGTLSEDELAEFEERLVWDQALMDEVDLAEKLREGLQAHLDKDEPASARNRFTERLITLVGVPAYAAAASFLLAVGLTSFVMTNMTPAGGPSPSNGTARTEIVPLFATRAASGIDIEVSDSAWTVLLIDAPRGFSSFRASVARQDDDTVVWSGDDLEATYPDSLALGMPGEVLAEGAYSLLIEGQAADRLIWQQIQVIPFSVSRP